MKHYCEVCFDGSDAALVEIDGEGVCPRCESEDEDVSEVHLRRYVVSRLKFYVSIAPQLKIPEEEYKDADG